MTRAQASVLALVLVSSCGSRTGLFDGATEGLALRDGAVSDVEGVADGPPGLPEGGPSPDAPIACSPRQTDIGVWCCDVTCAIGPGQGIYCCPDSTCGAGECVAKQALGCDDQHDCVAAGQPQNICCGRAQAGAPVAYCVTDPQCQELSGEALCFPEDPDPCAGSPGGMQCLPAQSPLFTGYFSCQ